VTHRLELAFSAVVAALIACVILSIVVPAATLVAGALALLALALGLPIVRRTQRIIGLVLTAAGLACLALALALGGAPTFPELVSLNQDVVGMIAATTFLGVAARSAAPAEPRLTGAPAVWRTLGVEHVLGSIVNMSSLAIVGDRLQRDGRLSPADSVLITRGFATAGAWSPFWAGFATATLVVKGANVPAVVGVGAVLAVVLLAASVPRILRLLGDDLPGYRGYALSWPLLRIPLALVAVVLGVHLALPSTPVPRIVTLGALVVSAAVFVIADRRGAAASFVSHVRHGIPTVRGETTLFVSAGVLAVGVGALLGTTSFRLPISDFTVLAAWALVAITMLLSLVGVHQLITIVLAGALLAPLHPEPSLFVLAGMIAWCGCITIAPLAGVQLFMNGRYGVPPLQTVRHNALFAGLVVVLALPALLAVHALAG
jgi:hypothetical protein